MEDGGKKGWTAGIKKASKDIESMSIEQITAYLQERKVQEVKERHEKALKAKEELEVYCQEKYQLTLAEVFTVSDKAPTQKQYRNPETGEIWTYSGKGKVKEWAKGPDGKPNPQYAVPDPKAMIG